eukprot:11198933-Lingulodinium_polyedra.AAC.1
MAITASLASCLLAPSGKAPSSAKAGTTFQDRMAERHSDNGQSRGGVHRKKQPLLPEAVCRCAGAASTSTHGMPTSTSTESTRWI